MKKGIEFVNVTFHRCYGVPIEKICERLGLNINELEEEDIKDCAVVIATDWLIDEAPEFLENMTDFVSHTTEIV
jgi:hypothetical protein